MFMIQGIYAPKECRELHLLSTRRVYRLAERMIWQDFRILIVIPSVPEKEWDGPPSRLYEISW